jgi:hypothetical protein
MLSVSRRWQPSLSWKRVSLPKLVGGDRCDVSFCWLPGCWIGYDLIHQALVFVVVGSLSLFTSGRVHGLTSKMIFVRELHGSHDQPTHTITMRQQEPTALQRLALNFAESVSRVSHSLRCV